MSGDAEWATSLGRWVVSRKSSRNSAVVLILGLAILLALLIWTAPDWTPQILDIGYRDSEHDELIARSQAEVAKSKCEEPLWDRLKELTEAGKFESAEAAELLNRIERDECAR